MGVTARLAAGSLRGLAESHPRLRALRARLTSEFHLPPAEASRLVLALVTHAAEEFSGRYLAEAAGRLRRIEAIRSRIASAIDHSIAEGRLPAGLDQAGLSRLFDDLQQEMAGLRSPQAFGRDFRPGAEIERLTGARTAAPAPRQTSRQTPRQTLKRGTVAAPAGSLGDAMASLAARHPKRAALLRAAMDEHGDFVGLAILAETESSQQAALQNLRQALGPSLPADQWPELVAAIGDLSRARQRALSGPGTAIDSTRRRRLGQMLPAELRQRIAGDRTILGPMADAHPRQLRQLWEAWIERGRKPPDFRSYVRSEGSHFFRPLQAEWQAAFEQADMHGLRLLKDAADVQESGGALRRVVNPRQGGTDLLGLRSDGELWYIDDKSHRLPPSTRATGGRGLNISEVSAFEGTTFIGNLRDDAATLEAGIARARAAGATPDPGVADAATRLRAAAAEIEAASAGWSERDFLRPRHQARIRAILDRQRIRLFVTSTMGDVTGITNRLRGLGISVLPPFRHPQGGF